MYTEAVTARAVALASSQQNSEALFLLQSQHAQLSNDHAATVQRLQQATAELGTATAAREESVRSVEAAARESLEEAWGARREAEVALAAARAELQSCAEVGRVLLGRLSVPLSLCCCCCFSIRPLPSPPSYTH